jgi:hypothetical protein
LKRQQRIYSVVALLALGVPTVIIGVHDAAFANDTPSRAFGVFMSIAGLSLIIGAIGALRETWWRTFGIRFAVVAGLATGVIAIGFLGLQLFYDLLSLKLALWIFVLLLAFGGAGMLWSEAKANGIDVFSRVGGRLVALAGVVLALFQLWYAQAAAPRRAKPSVTVTSLLRPLPARKGMARVLASIVLENESDTRVRLIASLATVTGVRLKRTSWTNSQMLKALRVNPDLGYDRHVTFDSWTILKTGSALSQGTVLDPRETFPTQFVVYMKPNIFDLARLRTIVIVAKADALEVDYSSPRRRRTFSDRDESGVSTQYPVVESAWVRALTHQRLAVKFWWTTYRRRHRFDVPDVNSWFTSDGKNLSRTYEGRLERLYSVKRTLFITDLAL